MKVAISTIILFVIASITMSQKSDTTNNTVVKKKQQTESPLDTVKLVSPPASLLAEVDKFNVTIERFKKAKKEAKLAIKLAEQKKSNKVSNNIAIATLKPRFSYISRSGKLTIVTNDSVYIKKKRSWFRKLLGY